MRSTRSLVEIHNTQILVGIQKLVAPEVWGIFFFMSGIKSHWIWFLRQIVQNTKLERQLKLFKLLSKIWLKDMQSKVYSRQILLSFNQIVFKFNK